MAATDFIVAIELGSTEISGLAGKKNTDGSIRILAHAAERSTDCIKKGRIYNLDKTAQCLTTVIGKLEDSLQASIKKVYVGIGGLSVKSVRNKEAKQMPENTIISQALIDVMMNDNLKMPLVDQEIIAVETQEYKIGKNQSSTEPVGISSDCIEGNYLNIVANESLKKNIHKCFKQTRYEIAGYILSPIATANAILTPNEKRSGCVMIDFGAETTTVAVYRGVLRHLAVIPLGGNNITKDICYQQIEEDDAEALKISYASAYTDDEKYKEEANKEFSIDKCSINAQTLLDIAQARETEILENVKNQIMLSGYNDSLLAGIIITGGAAKIHNMEEAIAQITKIDKIRIAKESLIELQNAPAFLVDGTQYTLIGLLDAGKDNCCKVDPNQSQSNFLDQLKEEEDKKKEEAERQRIAEEQARQQAAEEAARKKAEEEEAKRKEELQQRNNIYISLISESKELLGRKKYKEALNKAYEARNLHLSDKEDDVEALINNIERQKSENNTFSKLIRFLKDGAENLTKD